MLLEAVAVAERRRREDGRPEAQAVGVQDRVIVLIARLELIDHLAIRSNADPASETVVERGDRLAEQGCVVLERRVSGDRPPSRGLQIEPPIVRQRNGEPPRRTCRGMPLADMGEPHR